MRQYALDYGGDGIRANAVNADRIRTGLLTDEMIAQRSKARGLDETDYMGGNLLGREVTADDVAQAFVHWPGAQRPRARSPPSTAATSRRRCVDVPKMAQKTASPRSGERLGGRDFGRPLGAPHLTSPLGFVLKPL